MGEEGEEGTPGVLWDIIEMTVEECVVGISVGLSKRGFGGDVERRRS